ncbi:MAG TPA: Lon family ATP-dependent protease [Bacillota bacterium]|jgi:ATP-dependent Lon protease|nr:Lon family ATP-dependent protease [Bacillota bacterium]OPZ50652.1 MAG: Lon protease 2 [Firmicutes bacterium ADurb.BinA052]HNY67471.1 Lon family ATP-dependent protease [Bacillota bacterium]HOI35903.1 Lon family ATP-dependent protease [Bacillota bacterium]HPU75331.1 Lon family ATP-dependent protease [Bacillota bacterium]
MKSLVDKIIKMGSKNLADKLQGDEQLMRQVMSMFGILSDLYGPDKLVLKAGKLDALDLMRSSRIEDRILALERLVFEDPTIDKVRKPDEYETVLSDIEDEIADTIARRRVEDKIEKRISDRMQQRHEDYVNEIKMQILKEDSGPDTPETLRKLEELEELEARQLARSAMEIIRPAAMSEIVGQDRAVRALLAKVASPFPQHVILYGPPGVGKTTAARLALEEAKKVKLAPFAADARFVEVDGTTLRWDPREVTNPLLGSVHDPIYQGAKRDLAEGGVPEPKLGLVTDAHGGVLFIDEIGEMDPILLNKLLKVMEDKRVAFDSSYYDPADPNVPKYIKRLFEQGAPADFVLIGATTRDPDDLSPALRSRTAEVFFEPLTQKHIQEIVRNAAAKLGVKVDPDIPAIVSDYTIEGRKATSLLVDAYGLALFRRVQSDGAGAGGVTITRDDLEETIRLGRLSPYVHARATQTSEVGKVFGLGVAGFLGSVIEIEAVTFPAREDAKGAIRFNDTAGSMAKDSVFNAASVFRRITGQDLADYDVHVNVVGGGDIDGPSAGTAVLLAILSSIYSCPIRQDVAVTGELSIQGKVREVGGIFEKIYGARQAGICKVIMPAENAKDVPDDITGIEVVPVASVSEAFAHVFDGDLDFRKPNEE